MRAEPDTSSVVPYPQGSGALEGADNGVVPMELIETCAMFRCKKHLLKGSQ